MRMRVCNEAGEVPDMRSSVCLKFLLVRDPTRLTTSEPETDC
jgi:hypothetical protein